MKIKVFLFITVLFILMNLLSACPVFAQDDTITERQKDTLLLMTGKENSNYDICIVIDISGSMGKVIDKFKVWAEKVVESAIKGDTLILVRFDHYPRQPLIQEIVTTRDKDLFMGWLRKIETTQGFGTDIRASYLQALTVLNEMNEGRKKKGEPIRLQYIVFVSDGDDIPPAQSPFRNPGSPESLKLEDLINNARKEKLINILPIGMEFQGYKPMIKTYDPGHVPDKTHIDDPELQKFLLQMKDVLKRSPSGVVSSSTEKVPKKDYQFNIDWLSDKLTLKKISETRGEGKNTRIINFVLLSNMKSTEIGNITATATYTNTSGELKGRIIKGPRVLSTSLKPRERTQIETVIEFPQNWSFKDKKSSGVIHLTVNGDMKVIVEEEVQPSSGATPRPSIILPPTPSSSPTPTVTSTPLISSSLSPSPGVPTKKTELTYPFNTKNAEEAITYGIPVEKTLYLYAGLGLIAVVLIPLMFIYSVLVPITITLKMGEKAQVFRLAHGGSITIGGNSDFQVEGCSEPVAEIRRKFRKFVLLETVAGTFPDSDKNKQGKVSLKMSEGFALNAGGSYHEFEFLPGNQEFAMEEEVGSSSLSDQDDGDFGNEDFKF